ncbi:polysaccharide biosynthesis/export family protein [Flammeovirgaceae bacterium SG7u.111]|nr:polysaccharide biosynthesis/export family protein [Flammeovirgaceae bacterium SG7u.132]WPO34039.1 polysaccharide biosynthesis/export family protein [Flammeovirgaceae bacterium SG7u.111]
MKRICFLLLLFLASCVSHKDIVSLQDQKIYEHTQKGLPNYHVKANDILHVKVNSSEETTVALFNDASGGLSGGGMINNESYLYLNGYLVDSEGKIKLPVVGEMDVAGKTVEQIREQVDEALTPYLKQKSVTVKLANFRIAVMGEVNMPGSFYIYDNKISLLQALSMAGDFTYYSNRTKVKLVRDIGGKTKTTVIDFTKPDLLASEYYFLQPNDVVYVEPLKQKAFNVNVATISLFVSALSVAVLVVSTVLNQTK